MNEIAIPTDLRRGAEACSRNSERLLSDAEQLLGKNGNISSYVLYLSALEELGKGFILVEKAKKQESLSLKEWTDIIRKVDTN
jgi:AbiV family abortive infection protein